MQLDLNRIQSILDGQHSYYGGGELPRRYDLRWDPGNYSDLIARQLTPTMRVLDVGCGKGHILMEMRHSFQHALGIDTDAEFLQMAEDAQQAEGIQNINFRLLDYPREAGQLQTGSFDMVISIRGPLPDSVEGFQHAQRLLRPDGMLFCTEIAEMHYKEVDEVFSVGSQPTDPANKKAPTSRMAEARGLMAQNGFEVRLAADILDRMYFPDVYVWLEYICHIWSWLGVALPTADDPRIALFAKRNTSATGEVGMTGHVCWVAGVKR
jgi:SAM-dependent methyltransferase